LRRTETEFAGDRRQRRAEKRKIRGVERNPAERENKEIPVPFREWQPLQPRDELCGFVLIVLTGHRSPRAKNPRPSF
jgi:hypothetical protein